MAVETILYTGGAQYYDGNLDGCINGGEDFDVVRSNQTLNEYLFCLCDMTGLSSACRVSKVKIDFKSRYTLDGSAVAGWGNYNVKANAMMYYSMPTVSGSKASASTGAHGSTFASYTKNNVKSDSNYGSYSFEGSPANSATETIYGGGRGMACVHLPLSHNGNLPCRVWVKNCTFTVTRTRACYVTFQGDGITTKKVMYDYGATPSFGSTPTRTGYVFKGWKSGSTTYTGALPTAGETDVTYTAVWEKLKHTVSLSAGQGGSVTGGGTYDYGTSVTIKAVPNTGYHFVRWSDGNTSQTRTLTVTANVNLVAYFEVDKINKVFSGGTKTSVYIGGSEADSVNIGNTKVYG